MATQIYGRIKGRLGRRLLAGFVLVLSVSQLARFEHFWWTLLVFSPAIACGILLWTRGYNVRVEVEGETVRVVNPLRTYRLTKSGIQALNWRNGWECKTGQFVCKDGSRVTVAGLKQAHLRRDEVAEQEMARLREDLGLSNSANISDTGDRIPPT